MKKVVPATFDKIESSNSKLLSKIKSLIKQLEESESDIARRLMEQADCLNQSTNKMIQNQEIINHKLEDINHKLEEIQSQHDNLSQSVERIRHMYLYNNAYERKAIRTFDEYYKRSDYKKLFLDLVRGFSDEDVAQIVRILQRQKLALESEGREADLFTEAEQKTIQTLKKEMQINSFRVSDDMYCLNQYFLPVNHFEASVFVYKHGIDCIENLESLKNKDILDVGGFIGDSILILQPLTNRRVFSFEALETHYQLMKKTVELNHLENVVLEKMALGNENKEIEIKIAGSSSSVNPNSAIKVRGTERVLMRTLDSYVEEHPMDIGLIKVDIEGAEQLFMEGARKTIEKYKPVLLMSIYHNADDFFHIKPIIESWNLGYKFKIHNPVDFSISREVLLIAEVC